MSDDSRDRLEVLADELVQRVRRGEEPDLQRCAQEHPTLAAAILDLFPTLLALERSKRVPAAPAPPSPALSSGSRVGDFRIVRLLGRGGMGVVFEAVQESLGRRVALKLAPSDASERARARFVTEARAAATLQHESIVQVFGVGAHEGAPYFVMQLVGGRSLADVFSAEAPLEPRRAVQIVLQVARALEHAHERGVLHRDVKPANLLVDERDRAWVADFGVAKLAHDEGGLTRTGDVVGTLGYLAPERFDGQGDARADVYALGLVLHELVTGRRAFPADGFPALVRSICEVGVTPARQLRPELSQDLETLVLRATAREPNDRYQGAGAFALDLQRWLEDRPISARRVGVAERAWRWARRNPALAAACAVAALALALAAATGWASSARTTAALARESERRREAEEATRQAEAAGRRAAEATRAAEDAALRAERDEQRSRAALARILEALPRAPGRLLDPDEQQEQAQLVQAVLTFYDELAAAAGTDARLRLESACALRTAGVLRARLGQREAAAAAFARAIERLEALSASDEAPDAPRELMLTLMEAAALADDEPAAALAVTRARRAQGLVASLEGPSEDEREELQLVLACRLGAALARQGEEVAALDAVQGAAAAFERGDGRAAQRTSLLLELTAAREALSDLLARLGRWDQARGCVRAALASLARNQGVPGGRRLAISLYERAAECERALGRPGAAEDAQRQADEARRSLGRTR